MRYLTLIPGTVLLNPLRVTLHTWQEVDHPVSHRGRSSLTPNSSVEDVDSGPEILILATQDHKSSSRTAFQLGYKSKPPDGGS